MGCVMMHLVIPLIIGVVPCLMAAPLTYLDMSHRLDNKTQMWQPFQFKPTLTDLAPAVGIVGVWETNNFCIGEHVGTHIDSPNHMVLNVTRQYALDEIPLKDLNGPAVKIDVRGKVKNSSTRDYAITVEDLENHEKVNGRIPDGSMVFSCTGYGEKYGVSVEDYWGNNSTVLGAGWSFPAFGEEAAVWLIENRKIRGIGADVASCDVGKTKDFPVHRQLLSRNLWCMEHVARTCDLPDRAIATVYAFPLSIEGSSGFPLRVVAIWGKEEDKTTCDNSAGGLSMSHGTPLLLLLIYLALL